MTTVSTAGVPSAEKVYVEEMNYKHPGHIAIAFSELLMLLGLDVNFN